jgi:hypothetical protein
MTKNPTQRNDTPEPEGGRAAERLRDLMLGRFPAEATAESGEPEGDDPLNSVSPEEKHKPAKE